LRSAGDAPLAGRLVFIDKDNDGLFDSNEKSRLTNSQGAYRFADLPAGTYRIRKAAPNGWRISNPTSGSYLIQVEAGGTVSGRDFGNTRRVPISGTVFNDANANKRQDDDEPGVPNWRVYIDADNDRHLDAGEQSVLSDSSGNWSFSDLPAGSYMIRVAVQTGWLRTVPSGGGSYLINLTSDGTSAGNLFGVKPVARTISGTVFTDANANKKQDGVEAGLSSWRVYIDTNSDRRLNAGERSVLSDSSGNWSFSDLPAGSHMIRVVSQNGFERTVPSGGGSYLITLSSNGTSTSNLFGMRQIAHRAQFAALDGLTNKLYRIDTDRLGSPTLMGTIRERSGLSELTVAAADRLYTIDRDANTLVTVSASTAQILNTTNLDQDVFITQRGFDLSPGGVLYGVLPGMQLRSIDPVTGATAFIANITGAARIEAISFVPDGRLFAVGSAGNDSNSENLYQLNSDTGALTLIGPTGFSDIDSLAYGFDGFLYGSDSIDDVPGHLYRINLLTGSAFDLGSTGVNGLNGLVAISSP
jgi:hypothetical protein